MRVARAVTAGADGRQPDAPADGRYESAQWLAARLTTDLVELPGAHVGYLGDPRTVSIRRRMHCVRPRSSAGQGRNAY